MDTKKQEEARKVVLIHYLIGCGYGDSELAGVETLSRGYYSGGIKAAIRLRKAENRMLGNEGFRDKEVETFEKSFQCDMEDWELCFGRPNKQLKSRIFITPRFVCWDCEKVNNGVLIEDGKSKTVPCDFCGAKNKV